MELKYPKSKTSVDDMCEIIKFLGIKQTEYTDCTVLYEVTLDQLRAIHNIGKEQAKGGVIVRRPTACDKRRSFTASA